MEPYIAADALEVTVIAAAAVYAAALPLAAYGLYDAFRSRRGIVRAGSSAPWIYFEGDQQREWNPASGEPEPEALRNLGKPYKLPKGVRIGSSAKWVEVIPD